MQDLADLKLWVKLVCGTSQCGRPRTTHRFHYYFRSNLRLFVHTHISLSLSLLERRGTLFVPTFVREQFCNSLTFERSLTLRCSRFSHSRELLNRTWLLGYEGERYRFHSGVSAFVKRHLFNFFRIKFGIFFSGYFRINRLFRWNELLAGEKMRKDSGENRWNCSISLPNRSPRVLYGVSNNGISRLYERAV